MQTQTQQDQTFTVEQVSTALNHAADDVLEAIDAGDEGVRDAINLVVNAAIDYMLGGPRDLDTVIANNYQTAEDGDGPIEWAMRGLGL